MIEILNFKLINEGTLIASFNAKMNKWGGLILKQCTYFESGNKKWVNLPSKEYESEGKKKFSEMCGYEEVEMHRKLKTAILRAVELYKTTNLKGKG